MKYPIFLIGFMASGKTSKGKKLARKLEFDFIDLDEEIERKVEYLNLTENKKLNLYNRKQKSR